MLGVVGVCTEWLASATREGQGRNVLERVDRSSVTAEGGNISSKSANCSALQVGRVTDGTGCSLAALTS
jgi:hypothetical protein